MNDSTRYANFLPANNPFPWRLARFLALVLVVICPPLGIGCKTIRAVRVHQDQQQPLITSQDEARQQLAQGWALFQKRPLSLDDATEAALMMETAALSLPNDYEAHIKAARALAYVAEKESRKELRQSAAEHGIALARQARTLDPKLAEGHYWYALNVGLLADVDRDYGLDALDEMIAALKIAIELDPALDHAGPLRLMGLLHLRAPGPPVSVGSKRKAMQLFQRAVELDPQFPENYLFLGEAKRDLHRTDEARAHLQTVLNLPVPKGYEADAKKWKATAREMLKSLNK